MFRFCTIKLAEDGRWEVCDRRNNRIIARAKTHDGALGWARWYDRTADEKLILMPR